MNNNNLVLRCDKCKKMTIIKNGTENGIQYARIEINGMTRPWTAGATIRHYYIICKSCLDELIKELDEEDKTNG